MLAYNAGLVAAFPVSWVAARANLEFGAFVAAEGPGVLICVVRRLCILASELVCRSNFWSVRVRKVCDEARIFVLLGDADGKMKVCLEY